MTPTQKIALQRAIALLDASGVKYAILQEDGSTIGTLEIQKPKERATRRPLTFPMGTISKYLYPQIDSMQVGETVFIQKDQFDLLTLQSSASSRSNKLWGHESAITHLDRAKNHVEVLRIK
jgi:hypothetical protein